MEINMRRKRRKLIWTVVIVLAIAIFGAFCYVYGMGGNLFGWSASSSSPDQTQGTTDTTNLNKPTQEQTQAGNDTKSNSVKNNPGSATMKNNTGAVSVTASPVLNGSVLRIQTTIDRLTNTGICTLTLEKSSTVKHYLPVGVQALSNYSTCKFSSIDLSTLSSGTWNITVNFSDSQAAGTARASITLP